MSMVADVKHNRERLTMGKIKNADDMKCFKVSLVAVNSQPTQQKKKKKC